MQIRNRAGMMIIYYLKYSDSEGALYNTYGEFELKKKIHMRLCPYPIISHMITLSVKYHVIMAMQLPTVQGKLNIYSCFKKI